MRSAPPALFLLLALVAAPAPAGDIFITERGTYTDTPKRYHGQSERWAPSRDRVTPVVSLPVAAVTTPDCRVVWLGPVGATVCGPAVVREVRAREWGSVAIVADTVLEVEGVEVLRIRGWSFKEVEK